MTRRRRQQRPRPAWLWPVWLTWGCGWVCRFFLVVIVALVIIFGWRIGRVWNRRSWLGVEPYRVLLLHEVSQSDSSIQGIEVVSLWPKTNQMVALELPVDAVIGAVGGYGNYRMSALTEMGRVEGVGDTLLRDSVSWLLGVPIHQVYRQRGDAYRLSAAAWNLRRQGILGQASLPESWEAAFLLSRAKPNDLERIQLTERNVIRQRTESDGSSISYFEPALLDRFLTDHILTVWPEAAMTQVAAINASNKPGIAAAWARYARLGGFDIVSVTDQQQTEFTTKIIFSDKRLKDGLTGKALQLLYPLATSVVGDTQAYRAPIAIIFGLDSWKWLNDRVMYLD